MSLEVLSKRGYSSKPFSILDKAFRTIPLMRLTLLLTFSPMLLVSLLWNVLNFFFPSKHICFLKKVYLSYLNQGLTKWALPFSGGLRLYRDLGTGKLKPLLNSNFYSEVNIIFSMRPACEEQCHIKPALLATSYQNSPYTFCKCKKIKII